MKKKKKKKTRKMHAPWKVCQKMTSSWNIVVREHMGFGQKWLSEPWVLITNYISSKHVLNENQWFDDTFYGKRGGNEAMVLAALGQPL